MNQSAGRLAGAAARRYLLAMRSPRRHRRDDARRALLLALAGTLLAGCATTPAVPAAEAEPSAEDGRGIQLMRALVDEVTFTSRPQVGTVVHLEKQLTWVDGAVIQRLTENAPETEHGPWSQDERFGTSQSLSEHRH